VDDDDGDDDDEDDDADDDDDVDDGNDEMLEMIWGLVIDFDTPPLSE
jgi:hypothetical protein